MNITINRKTYTIGQLGFKDMVRMEDMGFSVIDMFRKQQVFSLAVAFAGVCAGCGREEAETLCEQHVMGGGRMEDIYMAFMEAVNTSGFFKKLLGTQETMEAQEERTGETAASI